MITEFDWYEIQKLTKDKQSQLILLYSTYLITKAISDKNLQNKDYIVLSNGRFEISKKLYFFWKDYKGQLDVLESQKLVKRYGDTYFASYISSTPQNYVRNINFIYAKTSIEYKIHYLTMLSQRRMNDSNNYIPLEYVSKDIAINPFTTIQNNKIYFTLENNTNDN